MKNLIVFGAFIFSTALGIAQDSTETQSNWRSKSTFGINGTQSSFVNWNAGGRNNISVLGYISAMANYEKNKLKWDNDVDLALGGLQYIGVGSSNENLQKTDDRIDLGSKLGYKMKEHFFLSFVGGFKTQFLDGFNFPNDTTKVSTFMAPGYLTAGIGVDYTPNDHFTSFLSPLTGKFTWVMDQDLANAGAFGVTPAVYDMSTGELLEAGENFRPELGAYAKFRYNKEIFTNINLLAKLDLFSNYLNNPQNIDVNADVLFNFKVNGWFQASLNWTLKYDHDIIIRDAKGGAGPRTQFKSVLGVGLTYSIQNFKEEKK